MVPISASLEGGFVWWSVLLTVLLAAVPGAVAGLAFALRDREFALPTPAAAGVVALVVALGTPFVVEWTLLVVWMIVTHHGE